MHTWMFLKGHHWSAECSYTLHTTHGQTDPQNCHMKLLSHSSILFHILANFLYAHYQLLPNKQPQKFAASNDKLIISQFLWVRALGEASRDSSGPGSPEVTAKVSARAVSSEGLAGTRGSASKLPHVAPGGA